MPRRKRNRIISKATARAAKSTVPVAPTLPNLDLDEEHVKRQMPISIRKENETETDCLFRLIYEKSRMCYCFTDLTSGIPWIRHEDIEDKGNGLFVIRFRCLTHYMHQIYFGCMADSVCNELNSSLNIFHTTKTANGIPFEDCVWVLQRDSKEKEEEQEQDAFNSLEEFPDNFKDQSTAEEIEARFEEAIEKLL